MTIEIVFFDAGETLLTPNPSWSEKSADVLRERGHSVSVEQLREAWRHSGQHFQNAADDGVMFSLSREASHHFWTSLYHDMLEHLGIDDDGAPEVLYETFSNPSNYMLFSDVIPTLDALKARGVVLGVISNFEAWLRDMLGKLGITHYFETIVISGEVNLEKPDPGIFKLGLEEAGVAPEAAVYIGDTPHFDAAPATELGMLGVLLDRHARYTDLEAPYPIVSTLGALPDLIDTR